MKRKIQEDEANQVLISFYLKENTSALNYHTKENGREREREGERERTQGETKGL